MERWWEPLCALQPGIAEEVWLCLFLTTLCYALLRPMTNVRPRRAVVAAVLIGALTHFLAHVPTAAIPGSAGVMILVAGLLHGVPMAILPSKYELILGRGLSFVGGEYNT